MIFAIQKVDSSFKRKIIINLNRNSFKNIMPADVVLLVEFLP